MPLVTSRAGGTPVLTQNGNRWIGAGHNAIAADVAGQDWIVYHAIDRADPYLDGTDGINERPMLMDRLDWVQRLAVRPRRPRAQRAAGDGAGHRLAARRSSTTVTASSPGSRSTGRCEWRPTCAARCVAGRPVDLGNTHGVRAVVRPARRRARARRPLRRASGSCAPPRFPPVWTTRRCTAVVLQVRGDRARAELSHARLGDPLAVVSVRLPKSLRGAGRAGAVASAPGSDAENVTVAETAGVPRHRLVREHVPSPAGAVGERRVRRHGARARAGPGCGRTRRPRSPAARCAGRCRRPTWSAPATTPASCCATRRTGAWTVATKLTIDLGEDTIRNYQQGGLVVYVDDDHFARLSHVAIWNTRQTEFGKEMPYAGGLAYGGTIVGPPADTT